MTTILESVGLKWVSLVAGFAGAVISLKFIDGLSTWQRATTVFCGTVASAYCTPLTIHLLDLSNTTEAPVAFLGGLFGMSIAGALISAIPDWLAAAKQKIFGGGQ